MSFVTCCFTEKMVLKSSTRIGGQQTIVDNSEVPRRETLWDAALPAQTCWDTRMWLCAAYLKPRHAAGLKSDVDPAVFQTVIYSVRFEFHLNTNTHVLFLAFRWGGSMSACIIAQPVPVAVWQLECTLLWQMHDLQRKEGYHHYIVCVYKTKV